MEELTASLEKLRVAADKDKPAIPQPLDEMIKLIHLQEDSTEMCQKLVEDGVLPLVCSALTSDVSEAQAKAAEFVAEVAKVEVCRQGCVSSGLVPLLVGNMASTATPVALQACRALGNICYEHDGGRVSVMEAGGAKQLLTLLQRASGLPDTPQDHQLRLVATGFLLNLLNSYDTVQDQSMDAMLVDILCQYLEKFAEDEDIPTHVLLSLSCMADTEIGRSLVISRDITGQLVRVLKVNESAEVTETCLELITNLAETEIVKTQMSQGGICESVIEVVKRHRTNPSSELSPPIIKTATDLIVLILVGDESMGIVYGDGAGVVYLELVEWLTAGLEDLQIAAALAMGNFARNDGHCIKMVSSGIAEKLLKVLSSHNTSDGDIRLQHALLSALRNLAIAKQNKPVLVQQNALDVLLPMVNAVETFPVVFKLLATLRMIIDGQKEAALKVGGCSGALGRLVTWCGTLDHPGVQGESSRLLAWIIKNVEGNKEVTKALLESGCLTPLVVMMGSEHAVMVNEASLALTLMYTTCLDADTITRTKAAPLTEKAEIVLKNPHSPPEIVANVLSMCTALATNESGVEILKSSETLKASVEVLESNANEQVKTLATALKGKL